MLRTIGIDSVENLFDSIPKSMQFDRPLDIPLGLSERDLLKHMEQLASQNRHGEDSVSFLGAGIGTETPSWGNIMSEGRVYFQLKPSLIFWAGLLLSACILSINLLGDSARDALDPKMKRRMS